MKDFTALLRKTEIFLWSKLNLNIKWFALFPLQDRVWLPTREQA